MYTWMHALHYLALPYLTLRCVTYVNYITLHYNTLHYIALHCITYIHGHLNICISCPLAGVYT